MREKKKKSRPIKILTAVAFVLLFAGIALILFPPVSNYIGGLIANGQADSFDSMASNIQNGSYEDALKNGEIDGEGYPVDENGNRTSDCPLRYKADIDRLYRDSLAYNEDLKTSQQYKLTNEYAYAVPSLDLRDYGIYDGIYGYVTAPSIDMRLPVYLGANDSAMSYGAAHLTYTSLPAGGESTNTVLAGHTGYIGRIFFDNIRNLQRGDRVSVTVYWGTINYSVREAKVLAPAQSQDIFIKNGEDRLTLVTCISDGNGGFNRYLVICEREK